MKGSLAAVVLASTAVVSGCGTSAGGTSESRQDYSARSYASVQQLARDSDLVVMGRPVAIVSRELDAGGEQEIDARGKPAPGAVPMTFFDFAVDRSLGSRKSPERIVVGQVDGSTFETPLRLGSSVVLYLDYNAAGEAPGITSVGDHYVPLSGDNGIFDVQGNQAIARSMTVRRLREGGASAQAGDRLVVTVSALARIVHVSVV